MSKEMPVLFVGHGSPTNAAEDNEFSRTWKRVGKSLPTPEAILCISAHWETTGTRITAMDRPETLYDFHGFPQELYEMTYPAPGAPKLAREIKQAIPDPVIHLDAGWGLDHGTWSVLVHMFPDADIPTVQVSLDFDQSPAFHHELGRKLKYLREQGVLMIGSGNMVHNLRIMKWEDIAFDWAQEIDEKLKKAIVDGNHEAMVDYESFDENMRLAVPTNEHYLPMLVALGSREPSEEIEFFCDRVTLGSVSMRSFRFG